MIACIVRKEFLEMTRDGRFLWAGGITMALLLMSLIAGWAHYTEVRRQHETARATAREHWLHQGKKNPHSAAHYGVYAFKPKMPLSLVDQGADAYLGVAVYLEAHKQNEFKYRPAQDGNTLQRFGQLTAAAVLQLLLPLLIVLLSFSAYAGEREQGTLRQLLSLGVRRSEIAIGKGLGIAGALGLLLVPSALIGAAVLSMAADNGSFAASLPRMGLLTLFYLLYFGVFVGVSLAVSARARSSRLALVTLLAFWIFNCLLAPRAASDLARWLYPTPSAFEFARAMEREAAEGQQERMEELRRQLFAKYNVSRIEDLPVNFSGVSLQAGEEHGNEVFDRHYTSLWDTFERQNRFHERTAAVAPLLGVRALSMGLAGTGFEQHRDFARAAENYRREFVKLLNEDLAYNGAGQGSAYMGDEELWAKVPDFHYEAPGVGWVMANHAGALALLGGWFLAAVAFAAASVSKVRVD
ncbi:MAG: ABC transporter permease [Bryobacteraceae bacterium]